MPRTARALFDAAEANGALPVEQTNINGNKVHSHLEKSSKENYTKMMELSDEYSRRYPQNNFHDLQTQKHFLDCCVKGWNGMQRMDKKTGKRKKIAWNTVRQRYTDWLAAWQREDGNERIENSLSIYNHMKTEEFRATVSNYVREKHYLTVPYFRILMEHMWTKDWHQYRHTGTMVNDYALYVFSMYSSARVGEYIESSARKGTGRGLKYKDITFIIFRNEKGEAETAILVERDPKGMTLTPQGRPRHAMYEDMDPLFACAVLPALAIALANDAFQDHHSVDDIFDIPAPRAGTSHILRIRQEMLEAPFFQIFEVDGPTGQMEKAMNFSNRTVMLGHRAGFASNITMHCTRREALVLADANGYSDSQRKQFAGHRCDIFLPSYASTISTLDGGANVSGKGPRRIVTDIFRGTSLQWFPRMEQSLPAYVQAELAQREEFAGISNQISELNEKLKQPNPKDENEAISARRDQLYQHKRRLISEELHNWQETQSRTDCDGSASVADRISYFGRIRHLDPPRDRLASSLFLNVPLRSAKGRGALQDMISVYTQGKVAYRPSLRPRDGSCPVCGQLMERLNVAARWGHISGCYVECLKLKHGFAELCFQCDVWITDALSWQEHCEAHLEKIETLPVQFNQIKYRHTPATSYMCPFCLFNRMLAATIRYKQWRNQLPWKTHIDAHILELKKTYGGKAIRCPDERCDLYVDSVNILMNHLQDAHCITFVKITRLGPSQNLESTKFDTDPSSQNGLDEVKLDFFNETIETLSGLELETAKKQQAGSAEPVTAFLGAAIDTRTRGRPLKQPCESHATTRINETGEKIKRGRPKKICDDTIVVEQPFTIKVTEKRKRGRPTKQQGTLSATTIPRSSMGQSAGKRKRGRPKKQTIDFTTPRNVNGIGTRFETGNRGNSRNPPGRTLSPHRTRYPRRNRKPLGAANYGSQDDYEGTLDHPSDEECSIFDGVSLSESEDGTVLLSDSLQEIQNMVKRRKR